MNSLTVKKSIEFIKPILDSNIQLQKEKPLVVGVSGPQGSGKTTTSLIIKQRLNEMYPTLNVVQFSMDDFYLTYNEQQEFNLKNSDNSLMQGRGLPGTHDLLLLTKIFNDLIINDNQSFPISVPVYDKSAHNGKGDRLPIEKWLKINKPVDVIIFEGWFNGYLPIHNDKQLIGKWEEIKKIQGSKFNMISDSNIIDINKYLRNYEKIWQLFDLFISIKTIDINNVYKWRLQQEHELIKIKKSGMTDNEVKKFIDRYMPVYYLYYDQLNIIEDKIKSLQLFIDESRSLVNAKF